MHLTTHTSAEKVRTGIPKALAKPKSANFSSPLWGRMEKRKVRKALHDSESLPKGVGGEGKVLK